MVYPHAEQHWTLASMRQHQQEARARYGEAFDRIVKLQPDLLALEAKILKIWCRLLKERPSKYSWTPDWYGPEGVKRALCGLVGWGVPTSAGPAPEDPNEGMPGLHPRNDSPEYERWHTANQIALVQLGGLASSEAYRSCYEYLCLLMPGDLEAPEGCDDETDENFFVEDDE